MERFESLEDVSQALLTSPSWGNAWSALTEAERMSALTEAVAEKAITEHPTVVEFIRLMEHWRAKGYIGRFSFEADQAWSKPIQETVASRMALVLKLLADQETITALLGDLEERSLAILEETQDQAAARSWQRRELRRTIRSLLWAQLRRSLGIIALVELYEKVRQ